MTVSISNKGTKRRWEEVAGEVRSSRHQPRTRRRVRVCAGCSTCAGKPECYRNTGGVVVCGVGHPIVKCEAAAAAQCKGCTEKQASHQSGWWRRDKVETK